MESAVLTACRGVLVWSIVPVGVSLMNVAGDDSDAVKRLRAEVARMEPQPKPPPAHPTAVEVLIKVPHIARPGEPVCHNEGWRWAKLHSIQYQGYNPDLPTSVYCVLPKGHFNKHMSKPRPAPFRRGSKYVFVWEDQGVTT